MLRRVVLLAFLVVALPALAESAIERGDAAWARRAEGHVDGRPQPEPIAEAVDAYELARTAEPGRLDVHWKLLRALWFSSEFAAADAAAKRALLDRGRSIADAALALVAERAGGRRALDATEPDELRAKLPAAEVEEVAHVYFWSAITLGAWSRSAGLLAAVRAGVAHRLHDYTVRAVALDPGVDRGGPLRLLSRLHAEVPHVPLLSGWVDRARSLPLAERAFALDPEHPGNPYILGLALLEAGGVRREEGLRLVERAATTEPRPSRLVEDLAVARDAAARLARERTP